MNNVPYQVNNPAEVTPVVILNWNGEEDTIECLKSVRASVPAGFVPVLVDNGSKPESIERLKRECSRIFTRILYLKRSELSSYNDRGRERFSTYLDEDSLVFIENGENLGFAKGNNVGSKFAELIGAEWVMLLNNDTVVSPDIFCELRKIMAAHSKFVAITPQIRHYRANGNIQNCGGDLTYFGSRKYKFANMDASVLGESDLSVITFITGCALLFKHTVTGPLSEDFFFGEEDYEFSLRMKKRSLQMACAHRAIVYHKQGGTIDRSSRLLGAIVVHYISRLINIRNYYSRIRWQLTKLLAYLYLPVLFARSGISPGRALRAIWKVESYVRRNRRVDRAEFQALLLLQ